MTVDLVAHRITTDPTLTPYTDLMKQTHFNPYAQQILDKGRDLPKPQKFDGKVPARFADRFKTYDEYQEAMADFLNGM